MKISRDELFKEFKVYDLCYASGCAIDILLNTENNKVRYRVTKNGELLGHYAYLESALKVFNDNVPFGDMFEIV